MKIIISSPSSRLKITGNISGVCSHSSPHVIQVPQKLSRFEKTLFTASTHGRAPVSPSGMVHANSFSLVTTVKITDKKNVLMTSFQINLGSPGFRRLGWRRRSFIHFKTSPRLPLLFRRILQRLFTVKLQKCFVTWLSISMVMSRSWLDSHFKVNRAAPDDNFHCWVICWSLSRFID